MSRIVAWDGQDLVGLLSVDPVGEGRWRSRHGDANMNGRSYGGQLLGQAIAAALQDVPDGRPATMMQFHFSSCRARCRKRRSSST